MIIFKFIVFFLIDSYYSEPLIDNTKSEENDVKLSNTAREPKKMWRFNNSQRGVNSSKLRLIRVGYQSTQKYPNNALCNTKYNIFTFLPLVLYEQFSYFLNFYFLVMALSQLIPSVRVGYLYTYWGPLCFVLIITLSREAYDDLKRRSRDRDFNLQKFQCWRNGKSELVASEDLKVADLVWVEKDQRVPADLALLHCGDNGSCFLRTDQLDGETDWKLRIACHLSQQQFQVNLLPDLAVPTASIRVEPPKQNFDSFEGVFSLGSDEPEEGIGVENVLWGGTVLATDQSALGCVLYTGRDCRMAMNTEKPRAKMGLLDLEINRLTKLLLIFVLILSSAMIILKGFSGPWYRYWYRYVLLFSYIIPLSLRVNLDLSKMVYAYFISKDVTHCPDTLVRSSTITEELGRINVLLCDKTGTLTKNEMLFKRLHMGTMSFGSGQESINEIQQVLCGQQTQQDHVVLKRTVEIRVRNAIEAVALCHNVTPSYSDDHVEYQAASPDEVCLVKFCEQVGIRLTKRDLNTIELIDQDQKRTFKILHMFPFTSELKRMGVIIQEDPSEDAILYIKGADTVIQSVIHYSDWLNEETGNLAREGLRILVYARKILTKSELEYFNKEYDDARLSIGGDRALKKRRVIETILERDMDLLCISGVEDRLQTNARETLESLKYAGIRVWMLTGDKRETAACIARSSRLFSRDQEIHWFQEKSPNIIVQDYVRSELDRLEIQCLSDISTTYWNMGTDGSDGPALVINGSSLRDVLSVNEPEFIRLASRCRSVIVCRCSPTQKADVVSALGRQMKQWRIAAVGDGGNDVSMIQRAHAGIGIVGKEGKQASLAADFSISQFSHLTPLILVHGRNCYKRSAAIAQFVMHRGLLISIMQAVFSSIFYSASVSLYQGFLMVGYATVYTMFPVFSLVLDCDVSPEVALTYPEIYKEIQKGRSLNFKTFSLWLLVSIYQGSAMMYLSLFLFEQDFIHVVSITFTSLVLTELLMVALTIRTWHFLMIVAELLSLFIYILSLVVFKDYFDTEFLISWDFLWRVFIITAVSCLPLYILKFLQLRFHPAVHTKLMQVSGGGTGRSFRSAARLEIGR